MQIAHLRIKEFGGWTDLELASFAEGLSVLYSPHGLDTAAIAQFVQSILFGFDDQYRHKFSPSSNVRWGGTLEVASEHDSLIIQRYDDGSKTGHLSVNGRHNRSSSQQVLNAALGGMDSSTFEHAFVIGLRERPSIQKLIDGAVHHGLVDPASGTPNNTQHLQRDLDLARSRLAALSTIDTDLPTLQQRHKAIADTIQTSSQPAARPENQQHLGDLDGQLKRWSAVLDEVQQHRERLRAEIDQLNVDHAAVQHDSDGSHTQLRREICANQLRQLTRCYTELRHAIHDLVKRRQELLPVDANQNVAATQHELETIDRQIKQIQLRDKLRTQVEKLESEVRKANPTPGLLHVASSLLTRLTCEQWCGIQIIDRRVVVKDAHGAHTDYQHLTDSARDQVYLSLALAVSIVFSQRGVRLPMVIDDVCLRAGSAWTTATVDLLHELGTRGHQIIALISQHDAAQLFQIGQVNVCQLPRGSGKVTVWDQTANNTAAPAVHRSQPRTTRHESGLLSYLHEDAGEARQPSTLLFASDENRFCLSESNPIDDAPSMDFDAARALRQIGVHRIGDLLRLIPTDTSAQLAHASIGSQKIRRWQAEALLACRVPNLSPFDAQILVACGIRDPEVLSSIQPTELHQRVASLAETRQWQSLIENGNSYEIERLRTWIVHAGQPLSDGAQASAATAAASQN